MKILRDRKRRKCYVVSFLIMILITGIFHNSLCFDYDNFSKRKLLCILIEIFMIVVVPAMVVINDSLFLLLSKIAFKIMSEIKIIKNRRNLLLQIILISVLCIVLVSLFSAFYYLYIKGQSINYLRVIIWIVSAELIIIFVFYHKVLKSRIEIAFAIAALLSGMCLIIVSPSFTWFSWDDQTHFMNALSIPGFFDTHIDADDLKVYQDTTLNIENKTGMTKEEREAYTRELEKYENAKGKQWSYPKFDLKMIAYLPQGVGLLLGQGLGLSRSLTFSLGRVFNLLFYVGLIYYALKKIKYGKILISCVALLSPIVLMASTYSTDAWILAWSILGYAHEMAIYQDDKEKRESHYRRAIVCLAIAMMPKAIYFPILFPLLFVRVNDKVEIKEKIKMKLWVLLGMLFDILIILVPMFVSSASVYNDSRGAGEIDVMSQALYILHNPLSYISVLFNFMKTFFSINYFWRSFQEFPYWGLGDYWYICVFTILFVALVDRVQGKSITIGTRIIGEIVLLGVLVLVMTSMYLGYTAVGANTICGVQSRYAYPLIIPFFLYLMPAGKRYVQKWYSAILPIALMALVLLYNLDHLFAIYYI